MTPQRSFEVPDVLEVQEIPSEEVRIVPELPTTKKVFFAKTTEFKVLVVFEVLPIQLIPSEEVRIVPDEPTAKNLILELAVGFEDVLSDFAVGFEDVLSDFAQDNLKKTKKIRKK